MATTFEHIVLHNAMAKAKAILETAGNVVYNTRKNDTLNMAKAKAKYYEASTMYYNAQGVYNDAIVNETATRLEEAKAELVTGNKARFYDALVAYHNARVNKALANTGAASAKTHEASWYGNPAAIISTNANLDKALDMLKNEEIAANEAKLAKASYDLEAANATGNNKDIAKANLSYYNALMECNKDILNKAYYESKAAIASGDEKAIAKTEIAYNKAKVPYYKAKIEHIKAMLSYNKFEWMYNESYLNDCLTKAMNECM